MKRRLLPWPVLSLLLFVGWLMLAESASVGQCLTAAVLAWAIPWLTTARLGQPPLRTRAWRTALRLTLHVLWDVVRSNVEVARRVLGPAAALRPRFVWVPLTLREPHAVALLAGIVTTTPGTVSADLSPDRRHLLVHALHCPDDAAADALVADIHARYEAPLKEIFE